MKCNITYKIQHHYSRQIRGQQFIHNSKLLPKHNRYVSGRSPYFFSCKNPDVAEPTYSCRTDVYIQQFCAIHLVILLEWTTNLDSSSGTLICPGAKIIDVFRAWIGAQLTICAQK